MQLIRFDWAIKKILRQKANFKVLEGFISSIIGRDTKINQILESETNKDFKEQKLNRVDILCSDEDSNLFLVEVQVDYQFDYLLRMLYSVSRAITEYMEKGQEYAKVRKIYSINILYFEPGLGSDYVYRGTTNFYGLHNKEELLMDLRQKEKFSGSDRFSDIYPEYWLINVMGFDGLAKDTLDQWIYFLKHEKVESYFSAKGLSEAQEILDFSRLSDQERREYNRFLDSLRDEASLAETIRLEKKIARREGLAEGLAEGLRRGELEGSLKAILQLYHDGLIDKQTTEQKLEGFLGKGFDDLVNSYLTRFNP
ncbi:MAG: Rpn family recombination-promoting nuclease/putative transposase [Candidatus Cloacimonetes bacterium]|nr:Rpn family recombination-promoting nuclease/putative transposase [Candidatus Cloacimonadota bacterium]